MNACVKIYIKKTHLYIAQIHKWVMNGKIASNKARVKEKSRPLVGDWTRLTDCVVDNCSLAEFWLNMSAPCDCSAIKRKLKTLPIKIQRGFSSSSFITKDVKSEQRHQFVTQITWNSIDCSLFSTFKLYAFVLVTSLCSCVMFSIILLFLTPSYLFPLLFNFFWLPLFTHFLHFSRRFAACPSLQFYWFFFLFKCVQYIKKKNHLGHLNY